MTLLRCAESSSQENYLRLACAHGSCPIIPLRVPGVHWLLLSRPTTYRDWPGVVLHPARVNCAMEATVRPQVETDSRDSIHD